jgi:folate-binding Fe-S cluster repair protein YgfZ
MVNLELIGGVSFRKGCYPGQEVVARSQYRGTLKRRMHLFMGRDDVVPMATPGAEVFHPSDPTQPCGTVVNVAHHDGQIAALISLKSAVLDADDRRRSSVHLGSVDGPALNWHPLPYAVPDEASDPV